MKKRATIIQISISESCTQPWEEMTPAKDGRYCAHCRKVVTDFTRMTDAQILDQLRKNGLGCGRFRSEQLDVPLIIAETRSSNWWTRLAATLLLAFGLSKSLSAQNRMSPAQEQSDTTNHSSARQADRPGNEIYGILKDEKGNPVINANVSILQAGTLIARDLTDFDGKYSVKDLPAGRYDVKFSFMGTDLTITGVAPAEKRTEVSGSMNTALYEQKAQKGRMVRTITVGKIYCPPLLDPEYPGGHATHQDELLNKAPR